MPYSNNKEAVKLEATLKQAEAKVRNLLAEYNAIVSVYRARAEEVLQTKECLNEKRMRGRPAVADIQTIENELKIRESRQEYAIDLLTSMEKEYDAAVDAKTRLETSSLFKPVRRETRNEITEEDSEKMNARIRAMRLQAEEEVRQRAKENVAPKVPIHRRQEQVHIGSTEQAAPKVSTHCYQETEVLLPDRHEETDTYKAWRQDVESAFKDYSRIETFPSPPFPEHLCTKDACIANRPTRALKICPCDIEKAIIAAGRPLKEERMFWHPDRFSQCKENVREEFRAKATDIFQVVMRMYEVEKSMRS